MTRLSLSQLSLSGLMTLPSLDLQPIYLSKVFCCFSQEEWPEQTKDFQIEWPEPDVADGMCFEHNNDVYIAVNNIHKQSPQDVVDTLSHEAYHGVIKINNIIGDMSPSEEMVARMVGIITGFLFFEYMKKVAPE